MTKITFYITILIGLFAINLSAQADNYGPIEWDIIGFSYVLPSGDNVSGGIGIYSEPRFNLKDNISIGLRYDLAIFGSADEFGGDIGTSASYALMGDYYFGTNSNKRAFAGLGIGRFGGASITVVNPDGTESEADGGNSIGLIPRVGYELGFLRFALEYNYAFDGEVPNYLGLKVGFNVGGRYKG